MGADARMTSVATSSGNFYATSLGTLILHNKSQVILMKGGSPQLRKDGGSHLATTWVNTAATASSASSAFQTSRPSGSPRITLVEGAWWPSRLVPGVAWECAYSNPHAPQYTSNCSFFNQSLFCNCLVHCLTCTDPAPPPSPLPHNPHPEGCRCEQALACPGGCHRANGSQPHL